MITEVKSRSSRKRSRKKSSGASSGLLNRALRASGLKSLAVGYQVVRFGITGLVTSPLILMLPLMLLLASSLTDYLVLMHSIDSADLLFFKATPIPVNDIRRVGAEDMKKTVQAGIYLFTLVLCVFNWRAVKAYMQNWLHLSVLIVFLLFTASYSLEPTKVVTNSILILVSILMPLLFAIGQRDVLSKLQNFYVLIFIPFFVSHLASLLLLLFYDADPFSIIFSTNRYGGFSGNPNAFGNSAALAMWAALALLLSPDISKKWRSLAILSLPLFLMNVAMSGSGTATVAAVLVVVLMVWMRVLAMFKPMVRFAVNILTAALFVCLILSVLLMVTPAEIFLVFTGSLGKDASMTGRTDLWALAKDAVSQRFYLGWSFDSHASVMSVREFDVRFNHYHNGFLDTMIAGGVVLMGIVLYNFGWFVARFIKHFRQNHHVYPLVVPLIMIVILNMSEYSLLRPLSEVWQLYIASFVLLTYQYVNTTVKKNVAVDSGRRKRSRRAMRWG